VGGSSDDAVGIGAADEWGLPICNLKSHKHLFFAKNRCSRREQMLVGDFLRESMVLFAAQS
jgi:hypothetical protein